MGRERQEREKRCGPKRDAKPRWMSPSATPATQNQSRFLQVPRLPRETKVDVSVWQRCAWQNGGWQRWSGKDGVWKMVRQRWCVKDGVCERWRVKDGGGQIWLTKICVEDVGWQRWCVKDGGWRRWCVKDGETKILCERWCVTAGGGRRTGGGGREADPGYRIKNKNPTQRCWDKEREETLTTNWFISGSALLSVIDNNKALLFISYVWNFRHRDIILFYFLLKRVIKSLGWIKNWR